MKIQENITLAPLTTLGIGGPARWFVEAASDAEITEACAWARQRSVPLFVLGGGSNVLVADAGFDGLALHVAIRPTEAGGVELDGEVLRAAAGVLWDDCVARALEANCAGLECLAGIPGTVGGTPVQNVGAYGQEVSTVIERVRVFDRLALDFVEFTNAECAFAYRKSRFNTTDRGRYVVTGVDYRLRQNGAPTLTYAELKAHFSGREKTPSLAEVAEAVRGIRRSKGMLLVEGDPDCRSAGSFFKNPTVAPEVAERVLKTASDSGLALRTFPADAGRKKIPAAWLIEQAGFRKGYAMGAAAISSRHTLALVNRGGATAAEILALAEKIANAVEAKFGIRLEMEPEMVGFQR